MYVCVTARFFLCIRLCVTVCFCVYIFPYARVCVYVCVCVHACIIWKPDVEPAADSPLLKTRHYAHTTTHQPLATPPHSSFSPPRGCCFRFRIIETEFVSLFYRVLPAIEKSIECRKTFDTLIQISG